MNMTPFFMDLHAAYRAELDDLATDSEGSQVLQRRLHDKRGEIGFLVQMMEISPEMVTVVFHRGFGFKEPAVMEQLLTLEADEFPEWAVVLESLQLQPWAQQLADVVLEQPAGEWFMTVAAALEYLQGRRYGLPATVGDGDPEATASDDEQADAVPRQDRFGDDDTDDDTADRLSEEAGADWLAEQGFDRKE